MPKVWNTWHQEQNKPLRCTTASAAWVEDQITGTFLKTVAAGMGCLSSLDDLEWTGFIVDVEPLKRRPEGVPDLSSPEVAREDEFAELLVKLALGLAGARLKRCIFMLCGWPGRSVLMRTGNSGAGAQAAQDLKRHHANWRALKDQTTTTCDSTQYQTCFNNKYLPTVPWTSGL